MAKYYDDIFKIQKQCWHETSTWITIQEIGSDKYNTYKKESLDLTNWVICTIIYMVVG
jgi:hypothetical protein